jgi:hypothetical protein
MREIFDIESWRQVVVDSLAELGVNVARFVPHLVGALALLAVGWILSKLVEIVARRLFRRFGLDQAADRTRAADAVRRAGIDTPLSSVFARLLFWTLMLTFVLSAVETLGLTAVTSTIDRLIGFLPNVIAAGLIILIGLMLGRFVRNVVGSGAAAANMPRAERIGAAAGGLVVLLVVVLALEEVGIETALLVTLLTVLVAAISLTIGVSFALGARPVVTHVLAGHFLRQSLPRGSAVEIQGHKGSVERVGPVETLLRDGQRAWSIPNAVVMEETVIR